MSKISEYIFYVWLLSLPFYRFDLVGTLSFDQIFGPVLVVTWLLFRPRLDADFAKSQAGNIVVGIILLLVFYLSHAATLISTQEAIWKYTYRFLTDVAYFMIPIMYVRSRLIQRRAEDCIVAIALAGAATSFLAAMDLLHLATERESTSRIAIEGLNITRSTGLFGAFGDMAILSAFTLMLVITFSRETLLFFRRNLLITIGVPLVILLGFIGSQSRNMALTVIVSLALYSLIGLWSRRGINWIPNFYVFLISSIVALAFTLYFFIDPLFEQVASLGGKSAMGTAHGRLEQYQKGMELLDGHYIIGAPAATQEDWGWFIHAIHNMWIKEFVLGGLLAIFAMLTFLVVGMVKTTAYLRADAGDQAARFRLVLIISLLVSTQFNASGTSVFWVVLGMIFANSSNQSRTIGQSVQAVRPQARLSLSRQAGLHRVQKSPGNNSGD